MQNNMSKREKIFFIRKSCLSCCLFGDGGAFCGDGFIRGALVFVFVYEAENASDFFFGKFKEIGYRFVNSDIKIAVIVNAARECAAGRYFSGEGCLRGAIFDDFFLLIVSIDRFGVSLITSIK